GGGGGPAAAAGRTFCPGPAAGKHPDQLPGADSRNAIGRCRAGGSHSAGPPDRHRADYVPPGPRAPSRRPGPDEPGAPGALLPRRGELDFLWGTAAHRAQPGGGRRRRVVPRHGPATLRPERTMNLLERWSTILDGLRGEGRYRELALPRGLD